MNVQITQSLNTLLSRACAKLRAYAEVVLWGRARPLTAFLPKMKMNVVQGSGLLCVFAVLHWLGKLEYNYSSCTLYAQIVFSSILVSCTV